MGNAFFGCGDNSYIWWIIIIILLLGWGGTGYGYNNVGGANTCC
jgi:hypothetical protein